VLQRQLLDRMMRAAQPALTLICGAALLLGAALPPAAAADVAQVRVVSPGGSEQTLSLDALAGSEDVVDRAYGLRSGDGEGTLAVSGFSLARILDAAGADPYGFSYLEVQRPAGGSVLLSRDQALDAGAFADGPPVVYATAAGTGFLRPNAGPEDLNASDSFEAPQGISVVLRKGTHLRVRAAASTRRTRPGQAIEFSAVVAGAGAGEQLAFSWYFDDGGTAAGPEASHGFAKRGSYDVVVGVTSDGNETGASAVVTIQVGAPLGGPDRKGGGTDKNADAPDHGSAGGPPTGSSSGSGYVPPVTSAPAPTSTPATPAPATKRRQAAATPAPGELIEGELVSAETDAPAPPAQQAAARTGELGGDGGSGGVPGAVWGVLATLGLLGAGAAVEAGAVGGIRLWRRGIA
jgi:hypothetical protein